MEVKVPEAVDDAAVAALRRRFRGALVTPRDVAYDSARAVFNAMIDKRPALIARCDGTEDVARAIEFACEQPSRWLCGVAVTASRASPAATAAWSSTSRG